MERVRRIELLSLAWKAKVLPLHNTRLKNVLTQRVGKFQCVDQANINYVYAVFLSPCLSASTNLAVRVGFEPTERSHVRRISNPLPSATRPPHHFGSPGWDRTTDTLINSQMQLPLCYWGTLTLLTTVPRSLLRYLKRARFKSGSLTCRHSCK